jgi:predicted nucleic acid-binding protein
MSMPSEPLFVDTGVWLHALRDVSPLHQLARERLLNASLDHSALCTSTQVARELCAALLESDPLASAVSPRSAANAAAAISKNCHMLGENPRTLEECLHLVRACAVPPQEIPRANIVATMLTHNVLRLLTAAPADYARYAELIQIVPLAGATGTGEPHDSGTGGPRAVDL